MRLDTKLVSFAVLASSMVACATFPRPQQRLEASQASVAAAEAVEADGVPKGALHLQLAREQVEKAKSLIEAGKHEEADFALQRAQADADLAVAYAKDAPAQEKAGEMMEELKKLESRNARSTD